MLRKISVLLLLLVVALAFFVGCSSKGSKNDGDAPVQTAAQQPAEEKAAEVKPEEEQPAEEQKAEETKPEEPQESASTEESSAEETDEEIELVLPSTLAERFSYAFGVYVADYYGPDYASYYFSMYQAQVYPELQPYFGSMGIYDYMNGNLRYSIEELNQMLNDYLTDYDVRMAAVADANLARAEAFLKENAAKEGIYTTGSGLQYEIVRQGTGEFATSTDSVELDYELKLLDGTVIDSSYARGEHSTFPLSGVIEGFREGVMLMPMGSHYIFYIHPDLGYGDRATGSMDPNSLLIFNVETYSIVKGE